MISLFRKIRAGRSNKAVLIKGAAGNLIAKVGGAGCLLLFNIYLPRALGTAEYGQYVAAIAWVQILSMIGLCGLGTAAIRFIAEYHNREKYGLMVGFIKSATGLALLFSTVIAIFAALFFKQLQTMGLTAIFPAMWTGLFLVPCRSLFLLLLSYLRGFKRPVMAELTLMLFKPVLLFIVVYVFIIFWRDKASAISVVWIELIIVLMLSATLGWMVKTNLPVSSTAGLKSVYSVRQWLAVAIPLLLMGSYATLNARADIVILGFFCDAAQVGIYNGAVKLATLINFGLGAINGVLSPYISSLYASREKKELQELVRLAAWGTLGLVTPVWIAIMCFPNFLLSIFGPAFTSAKHALLILACSQLFNCLCGSVVFLLSMTGNQRYASRAMGTGALLNIVLNFLLVPRYGINGAAVATALTTVVWNVMMVVAVIRKLNLNPTILPLFNRYIRACAESSDTSMKTH